MGGVGEGGVRGGDEGDEGEMKGVRKNPSEGAAVMEETFGKGERES